MDIRTLALTGTAALLLTACGSGSPDDAASTPTPTEDPRTGEEVVEDAAAALRDAGAFRAQGSLTQDGTESGIDMQFQDDGSQGTLTLDGQDIELLVVGEEAYAMAGAAFWASFGTPEAFAEQIAGRWLLLPDQAAGDLGPIALDGFIDELLEPESPVVQEVETGQVDGEDVLVVSTEAGSTLSVLAGEDSYPVRIEGTTEEPGQVDLSGFGERQEIEAPTDFLDLEELGG